MSNWRALMLTVTVAGCVSREGYDASLIVYLSARVDAFLLEAEQMKERRYVREHYRKSGYRFCEEGEWPQYWREYCKTCWCDDQNQVRRCMKIHCTPGNIRRGGQPWVMCGFNYYRKYEFQPLTECIGDPWSGADECYDHWGSAWIDPGGERMK